MPSGEAWRTQMTMTQDNPNEIAKPGLELEYNALREELNKRMEFRNQIIFAVLLAAGTILTASVIAAMDTSKASAAAVFVYVPIAVSLAALWAQNDVRVIQLGKYIREHLEPQIPGLGWESHRKQTTEAPVSVLGIPFLVVAAGSLFLITELMSLLVGFYVMLNRNANVTIVDWVFGGVSILSLLMTAYLVAYVARQESKR